MRRQAFEGIEKITHYGGPKDDFIRVVDIIKHEGDNLIVDRSITLKAPLEVIVLCFKT